MKGTKHRKRADRTILNRAKKLLFVIFILGLFYPFHVFAQNGNGSNGMVKVFLDCDDCDFSYFRRTLNYIDYVRDPLQADVHVFFTVQFTASGGRSYRLNFIGRNEFESIKFELKLDSPQSDTDALRRDRLVRQVSMGMLPFLSQTGLEEQLEVSYKGETNTATQEVFEDRWDYWVFRLSASANGELQQQQNDFSVSGQFRINRITPLWKIINDWEYRYDEDNFKDGESTITAFRSEREWDNRIVHSLNSRWSVGLFSRIYSTTFRNIDWGGRISPAIEFNFFPWDESDRQVFGIAYFASFNHFDYIETTLFEQDRESRFSESLRLQFILRQPWGEIESELEGSHYFHDFSKYRVSFYTDFSIRITKGFAIFAFFRAASIHDQLYLAKGDISLEEVLLRQRQLATTFSLRGNIGARYTFGSIYNNVVNPRL